MLRQGHTRDKPLPQHHIGKDRERQRGSIRRYQKEGNRYIIKRGQKRKDRTKTSVTLEISNDYGVNWHTVTSGDEIVFQNAGTLLNRYHVSVRNADGTLVFSKVVFNLTATMPSSGNMSHSIAVDYNNRVWITAVEILLSTLMYLFQAGLSSQDLVAILSLR